MILWILGEHALEWSSHMANFLSQIFGSRPRLGNITNPTSQGSAYWQLGQIYPNLSQTVGTAAGNINQELQGQLPTDVANQIKDQGAAWGLQTGMPGSGAAANYTLEDLGMTSLQEQQQGLANYLNFAPALQSMFTLNPEGVAAVDVEQAAPKPEAAGLEGYLAGFGGDLLGAGSRLGAQAL